MPPFLPGPVHRDNVHPVPVEDAEGRLIRPAAYPRHEDSEGRLTSCPGPSEYKIVYSATRSKGPDGYIVTLGVLFTPDKYSTHTGEVPAAKIHPASNLGS